MNKQFPTLIGLFFFLLLLSGSAHAQTRMLISGDVGTLYSDLTRSGAGFSATAEFGFQFGQIQVLPGAQMILGLPTEEDADADGYLLGGRAGYVFGFDNGFNLPVTAGFMYGELDLRPAKQTFLEVQPSINTHYGFVFGPYLRGGYMWHNGARSPVAGAGLRLTWEADPFGKNKVKNPTFY
jgi:hypothetical protein